MARKLGLLAGVAGLTAITAALVYAASTRGVPSTTAPLPGHSAERASPAVAQPAPDADLLEPHAGDERADAAPGKASYMFHLPSGQPALLTCLDARRIVEQVRTTLAYAPRAVPPEAFATATADWLDPYGLWSASPDSPVPAALELRAADILRELESADRGPCSASRAVGDALVPWNRELLGRFDDARAQARAALKGSSVRPSTVAQAAADALFDDESRPARELATSLGEHAGRLEQDAPLRDAMGPYVEAARTRFFPALDAEGWASLVRAAAVRAYVQLIDPHGAWAPADEEASVYDVDLDPQPPELLWEEGTRTAVGVRVTTGPMSPLETGDVVLAIGGVATAGLPPEQLDQLAYATTDAPTSAPLVVLRRGEAMPRTLELPAPGDGDEHEGAPERAGALPSYRVAYGAGDVLVVEIHDVRSDLGDELAAIFRRENSAAAPARRLEGLVLDLRDDGGGSTEGAIAALGLFVPGAPLFPMAHRDGTIEVDRAPEPPTSDRWTRPVAVLVDGDTASAAEMIAGALTAYRRAVVVGERTYGKGCAQEYLDDRGLVGVLRLTTLLYALPDGSPVQGVGIEPSLLLPAAAAGDAPHGLRPPPPHPREADEPAAAPTWRGPDVRDPTLVFPATETTWPEPRGPIGPCREPQVCRALRGLGGAAAGKRPAAVVGNGRR